MLQLCISVDFVSYIYCGLKFYARLKSDNGHYETSMLPMASKSKQAMAVNNKSFSTKIDVGQCMTTGRMVKSESLYTIPKLSNTNH